MDALNEKKWFVYMGNHHEGPFSVDEIQGKMAQGEVTTESFVWAEGMSDWKVMKEVTALEALLNGNGGNAGGAENAGSVEYADSEKTPPEAETLATPSLQSVIISPLQQAAEPTGNSHAREVRVEVQERLEMGTPPPTNYRASEKNASPGMDPAKHHFTVRPVKSKFLRSLVLIVIAGIGGSLYMTGKLDPVIQSPVFQAAVQTANDALRPLLSKVADRVPVFSKWISPLAPIEDVTKEEFEELKAAAGAKLEKDGPKVAFALAQSELAAPVFYIASNLPDGAQFDLFVEGVPETLLNQLTFSAKAEARTLKKIGKSTAVKFPDGKAVPRGQYMVYLIESEGQPERVKEAMSALPPQQGHLPFVVPREYKILVSKKYFLGGKQDNTYAERLKEFHDKLRAKAETELSEIKQFAATLESQYTGTNSKFASLHRGKLNPVQRKAWNDFHGKWSQLTQQINETFQKWTPAMLHHEYFYGVLYQMTQHAGETVEKVHTFQHSYFSGPVDPKVFQIQLGEATTAAQNAIDALKNKIEQAQKIPPSPNGMPRKEGL